MTSKLLKNWEKEDSVQSFSCDYQKNYKKGSIRISLNRIRRSNSSSGP